MRWSSPALLSVFLTLNLSAGGQGRPIPPGVRQADRAEAQTEKNIPPPESTGTQVNLSKLTAEAEELSKLAQTIPLDASSVRNGTLPKDFARKLREIEKLAKHMRAEIQR